MDVPTAGSTEEMAALAAGINAMRPLCDSTTGPLVSMIVPTRDGAHHLRRLCAGLQERTAYRSFEVVVVDNASRDDTSRVLAADWGFPIRTVVNARNHTFSEACNQGAMAARGEFLLLINNDVDPINPGWLGRLVEEISSGDPSPIAAGALLIYPSRPRNGGPEPPHPDLTVQHFGMAFDRWRGGVRAANMHAGADPLRLDFAQTHTVPGVTAACMLIRTEDFSNAGGMPIGYVYGSEDWDLCLRLSDTGRAIVAVGGASLFHHESASINLSAQRITRMNRKGNHQRFAERWSPRLSRSLLLDRLHGARRWSSAAHPTIAISLGGETLNPARPSYEQAQVLASGFTELGWTVESLRLDDRDRLTHAPDADVALVTRPVRGLDRVRPNTFLVAWVIDRLSTWDASTLQRADLVLAGSALAAEHIAVEMGVRPAVALPATIPLAGPHPEPSPTFEADYLFIGDRQDVGDRLLAVLDVDPSERFLILGDGWEDEPRAVRYWRGPVEGDQRAAAYASTKLVIAISQADRSAADTQLLDAINAGALPITDDVERAPELLGSQLPTFTTAAELRSQLSRYLGDAEERGTVVDALQSIVADRHRHAIRASEVAAAIAEEAAKPMVALKISPHSRKVMERWGDTHFARQFARALRRSGFRTGLHILPEWDLPENQHADIVIHLRGLHRYVPKPGALNLLWVISHPDDVTPAECERYDAVLCASRTFAEELQEIVDVPVHVMEQAADPTVFRFVEPDPSLRSEVLFVGNARWPIRRVPRWLLELGAPLSIYGSNWDGFAESHLVRGAFMNNASLHRLYCSADIVVNDHWADMREHGFISNRVFDALACGAFIISDRVDAIEELFGDAVPMFSSKQELADVLAEFGDDPVERSRRALRGMEIVHAHHTFDARAEQLRALLRELAPEMALTLA